MPALPTTGFVMIHSDFAFAFFQSRFNGPTQPSDADEFRPWAGRGRVAEVKLYLWLRLYGTPTHYPDPRAGQTVPESRRTPKSKVGYHRPAAAFLDHATGPFRFRQAGNQFTHFTGARRGASHSRSCSRPPQQPRPRGLDRRPLQPHSRIGRDFDQIPFARPRNFVQKRRVFAKMRVGGDPTKWNDMAAYQIADHRQSQLRFGLEANAFWNASLLPALAVVVSEPSQRQIQPLIEKGETARTGVNQEHPFLTVGDLAQMTAVLRRDPHRAAHFSSRRVRP